MSLSIDQAFVKQYEADVHLLYSQTGSRLGNTIRKKSNVQGQSTTFQKVGSGVASQKTRHGLVPTMSLDHTNVECTLSDYFAADYIDSLDMLKIGHDERSVVQQRTVHALGVKTDQIITAVLDTTTNTTASTGGMTEAKVLEAYESLNSNWVPDDGERYLAVSPKSWNDLLGITSFADADYVGYDDLPFKNGTTMKNWLGIKVFMFPGLPIASSVRSNFLFHRSAAGIAYGQDVSTEIAWVPERDAWLIKAKMSLGACMIEDTGVYNIKTTE